MDENVNAVSQDGFPTLQEGDQQLTLFNLQEIAVKKTHSIADLKSKIKEAQEMYEQSLNTSEDYKKVKENLKTVKDTVKGIEIELNRTPQMATLIQKIKDLKYEMKEKKMSVSDYALQVLQLSGNNEFEKDGEVFQILTIAKLVKRKQ